MAGHQYVEKCRSAESTWILVVARLWSLSRHRSAKPGVIGCSSDVSSSHQARILLT